MLIGEQRAVSELWEAVRSRLPEAREDRPGQPVYAISAAPEPGGSGLRAATFADLDLLVPACALAHESELGIDPAAPDADGFRWRTRAQIEEGRSWLWEEDGVILFKAEASAWTPQAVQLQQVWTDPEARRAGNAGRGLRDLIRLLLERVPTRLPLRPRRQRRRDPALRDASGWSTCSTTAACSCEGAPRSRVTASPSAAPRQLVNGDPGVACPLTEAGRAQARALGRPAQRADRPLSP